MRRSGGIFCRSGCSCRGLLARCVGGSAGDRGELLRFLLEAGEGVCRLLIERGELLPAGDDLCKLLVQVLDPVLALRAC